MAKRIVLFMAVNLLVILVVSVILSLFNVEPYITPYGLNLQALLIFCLIWGMAGAFISLAISRIMAKKFMGVQVIDPSTTDPTLQRLVQTVHNLAHSAGIPMPEVGVYDSPEVNAFATGPTKKRSLVAVSTGLLRRMERAEVEGVLSHEVAHIANGDMVTMTLLQGVVNAFVMFLARVVAYAVTQALARDREEFSHLTYFATTMVFQIVFMILGSMVVAWFSRYREFRADAGGASLGGRENMVRALESLRRNVELVDPNAQPAVQTMKISGRKGLGQLFSTHPPLEERIERLRAAA